MKSCIELARRGGGYTNPNPRVGSIVLSSSGEILGKGWHAKYGREHAEVAAILDAENNHGVGALSGATIVVNLEPCNHHGKTPPCSHLVAERGFAKVVVGARDPNGSAAGGVEYLRRKGIETITGVEREACFRLNEGFYTRVMTGRPMVTLKMAQTVDGFAADESGNSKWISNESSRTRVHEMRSFSDVVLTGRGTAAKDNPRLTIRHVDGRQPIRVVLDSKGQLDNSLDLFSDEHAKMTIAVIHDGSSPRYASKLKQAGGRIWIVETEGLIDLRALILRLGEEGGEGGTPANDIFVEAGPTIAQSLLADRLVDRLYLFTTTKMMGSGIPTFGADQPPMLEDIFPFVSSTIEDVDGDILFTGFARACPDNI